MGEAWQRAANCCTWAILFPCRCSRKDLETALGGPHESLSADGKSNGKREPLDDEPIYPDTCRRFQGHAPQLPGPRTG